MALPASGELGGAGVTTAQYQARIEALRDEVATLNSNVATLISELNVAEAAIVSNDDDITGINSALGNKLDASVIADYGKAPLVSNATVVWSGPGATANEADFTGAAISAGHYLIELFEGDSATGSSGWVSFILPAVGVSGNGTRQIIDFFSTIGEGPFIFIEFNTTVTPRFQVRLVNNIDDFGTFSTALSSYKMQQILKL